MIKILDLDFEQQEHKQWCWAAVATMIKRFYEPSSLITQCRVVNEDFSRTDCCGNGGSVDCNRPTTLEKVLSLGIINHFRSILNRAADVPTIINEIEHNNPTGVRIMWDGLGGHFVLVKGYDNSDTADAILHITDPLHGESIVSYSEFADGYLGTGKWTDTYFTK